MDAVALRAGRVEMMRTGEGRNDPPAQGAVRRGEGAARWLPSWAGNTGSRVVPPAGSVGFHVKGALQGAYVLRTLNGVPQFV